MEEEAKRQWDEEARRVNRERREAERAERQLKQQAPLGMMALTWSESARNLLPVPAAGAAVEAAAAGGEAADGEAASNNKQPPGVGRPAGGARGGRRLAEIQHQLLEKQQTPPPQSSPPASALRLAQTGVGGVGGGGVRHSTYGAVWLAQCDSRSVLYLTSSERAAHRQLRDACGTLWGAEPPQPQRAGRRSVAAQAADPAPPSRS